MKKIITFAFIITWLSSMGQKEGNIWCFGSACGVDFNSGSPVSFAGVVMSQQEGCSSIADTNGNLLFYSDGITVRDRNHAAMPNGTGLWGGGSSTQSALIVKQPGNANIYYVFTTAQANGANGFAYSIVDMTLNSGLGDVTTKNVQLFTTSAEKVCATRHSNGTDVWVMGHEMGTNGFRAYLLSSAGLNATPVISNLGSAYASTSNMVIGYLKFSHDGRHLAAAIRWLDTFELFDFNNSTGTVTNTVFSFPTASIGPYGVEFSPDDTKLYMTDSHINQFDITSGNAAAILATKDSIGPDGWALQLGPDLKIYCTPYLTTYLDVINSPNLAGAACNYVSNAVSVGAGQTRLGLPGFVSDLFNTAKPPVAVFTSSDTAFCNETGECIDFTDHSTGNPTSWQWIFTGATPSTSTLQNPTNICYYNAGTYPVTLIVSNSIGSDTLDVTPLIIFHSPPPPPVVTAKGDTVFSSPGPSYQWFLDGSLIPGATDSFYVATKSGTYAVQTTDSIGCVSLSNGIYVSITAAKEMTANDAVKIYPDPLNHVIVISGLNGKVKLEMRNILGEIVFNNEKNISAGEVLAVSTSILPSGIYVISIDSNDSIMNQKFIVQ